MTLKFLLLEALDSLFHKDNHPVTDTEKWTQDGKQQKDTVQFLQSVLTLQTKIWKGISSIIFKLN